MTSSDRPTASGVFVVRDPVVCDAIERLLAPHRTDSSPADGGEIMDRARNHVSQAMTITAPAGASIEEVLDLVSATANSKMQDRIREAESAAAHAESDADGLRADLEKMIAKVTELQSQPSGRRPTVSAQRLKDQTAFADLADRMDRQAASQSQSVSGALRLAAKAVRDEIAIVYGPAERKAS